MTQLELVRHLRTIAKSLPQEGYTASYVLETLADTLQVEPLKEYRNGVRKVVLDLTQVLKPDSEVFEPLEEVTPDYACMIASDFDSEYR